MWFHSYRIFLSSALINLKINTVWVQIFKDSVVIFIVKGENLLSDKIKLNAQTVQKIHYTEFCTEARDPEIYPFRLTSPTWNFAV